MPDGKVLKDMDIHQLRVFASVFRNRSFTRASEELNLSQPTVSDHIKGLEEALNARLFDRLGRSIAPTREALLLYPKTVELIEGMDALRAELMKSMGEEEGELLIGASSIPGTYIIPKVAARFKEIHPGVSVRVNIEDSKAITLQVSEHALLLGVVGARSEARGLRFEPFMEDELVLAGTDVFARKNPLSIEEAAGLPFVLREEGSGTRKTMDRYFAEKGISPERLKVAGIFGSTAAVKEAVKEGIGVSAMSRLAITDELRTGLLREIKIRGLRMTRCFYIVTHRKRTLPGVMAMFIEALRGSAKLAHAT